MVEDRERTVKDYIEVIGYMLISHSVKVYGRSSKDLEICLVTF